MEDHYLTRGMEALEACRNPMFVHWHDDRIGKTHAVVLAGETSDTLHRSNLDTALDLLESHGDDAEQGFVNRSGYPWVSFLLVRVLTEEGTLAQSWIDTVDQVLDPLEDYPVLDEEAWMEAEHDELVAYVRDELRDEEEGSWADAVLEHLYVEQGVSRVEDVANLDETVQSIYVERVNTALEQYRQYNKLRIAGNGQQDIFGNIVQVPEPPHAALSDLVVNLPTGVEYIVEDLDEYRAAEDALAAILQPA